jgi:hypothetical protein
MLVGTLATTVVTILVTAHVTTVVAVSGPRVTL